MIYFQKLHKTTVSLIAVLMGLTIIYCKSSSNRNKNNVDAVIGADTGGEAGWTYGEGIAQIYQGDKSLARDRALRAAKKDAVKRQLGAMISGKTVTEASMWISGQLTSKFSGLVKQHSITNESVVRDIYKVKIKAYVEPHELKSAVEELLNDWDRPVIFAIVSEKIIKNKQDPYSNTTTNNLSEYFIDKSFALNKTSKLQTKIKAPVSTRKITGLIEKTDADFDLLLFGSTKCKSAGNVMNSKLISGQVDINLSLFDVATKRLIASTSKHGASVALTAESACRGAIKKVSKQMGDKLFSQMLKKWKKEYGQGKSILLTVKGIQEYKSLYNLENDIRDQLRGVVDVVEKSYRLGRAELTIIYHGQTKDLAQELVNKKLKPALTLVSKRGRKIVVSAQ